MPQTNAIIQGHLVETSKINLWISITNMLYFSNFSIQYPDVSIRVINYLWSLHEIYKNKKNKFFTDIDRHNIFKIQNPSIDNGQFRDK